MYTPIYPSESIYLEIQGLTLHLRRWPRPNKPKLLLLHGWMDASITFQFIVDLMPPEWDVYALDWRGFGLSQHQDFGYYNRSLMLTDLHKVRQYLCPNNEPLPMLGHSMGGILLSSYAGALPEMLKNIIIIEGFGVRLDPLSQSQALLRNHIMEHDALRVLTPPPTIELFAQRQQQRNPLISDDQALFIAHHLATIDDNGTLQYRADQKHHYTKPMPYNYEHAKVLWSHINCPTLLIHGDTVPQNYYLNSMINNLPERLRAYPNADILKIEGAGHMLHWEAPKAVASAVTEFLQAHYLS